MKELEAFRGALRARGLAFTHQRELVAEAVLGNHGHFAADDLLGLVRRRDPRVGRVTVYRTLSVLVDSGLVEERRFRKDRVLYEHVVGHAHHDHIVCLACGRVQEFSDPVIEKRQAHAARSRRFRVVYHQHTLFGYCDGCGGKGAGGPDRLPAPRRSAGLRKGSK